MKDNIRKKNSSAKPSFNFDEEPAGFLDDIFIVNGSLLEEGLDNNLILATNIGGEDLKKLLGACKNSGIYVFSDENSLYKFRDCLKRSQGFLETGFNMVYLEPFKSQESAIKVLSYFYGRENLDKNREELVFINQDEEDFREIQNQASSSLFYIFRDAILPRDIDGFSIEGLEV